jgi:uncharacterized protein YcnI
VRSVPAAAAVVFAIALASSDLASAHVTVAPPFLEKGTETALSFAVPNERPPHATVMVRVGAPQGLSIVSAEAPPGWHSSIAGSTVTWSGGRIAGRRAVVFPIRAVARMPAGTYAFAAAQGYDDGATVHWVASISVLPASASAAPKQRPWKPVAAGVAGLAGVAAVLVVVRRRRRRPLQDR